MATAEEEEQLRDLIALQTAQLDAVAQEYDNTTGGNGT